MSVQKQTLSPRDLAQAIGVSESSLKRWADDGLLQMSRTAGGHRRIHLTEAVSYIRRSGMALANPRPLGLDDLTTLNDCAPTKELDYLLVQAIRDGDRARSCGLTIKLYLSGRSVCEICDGPIKHVLRQGATFLSPATANDNPAIDICLAALQQLCELLPMCTDGTVAVLPTSSSPQDQIVLQMMKTVLAAECWQRIEASVAEIAAVAKSQHAKLVAAPAELFDARALGVLSEDLASTGGRLVLMGSVAADASNISHVDSMSEFASLVRYVDASVSKSL